MPSSTPFARSSRVERIPPRERPPPALAQVREKGITWMGPRRSDQVAVPPPPRFDEPKELTLSEMAQYSVVRQKGTWQELRDESDGKTFYVDLVTKKTVWNPQKTPFRTKSSDSTTLRERKMSAWRQLLQEEYATCCGRAREGSGHRGIHIDPPPPPSHPSTPPEPELEAPSESAVLLGAYYKGALTRNNWSVTCPVTGNRYSMATFRGQLENRKVQVREALREAGVPDDKIDFTMPSAPLPDEAPPEGVGDAIVAFNEEAYTCYKGMVTQVMKWAASQPNSDELTSAVSRALQKCVESIAEPVSPRRSSVGGRSFRKDPSPE